MLNFEPSTWRLIISPAASGAWNMAVDEAMLEAVGKGAVLPTLRLYAWQPACLSLGYAQPLADADLSSLQANGWDVVRRPTGGRAILHTDELTYCVVGPQNEPRLAGGVLESYRTLSVALLQALQLLGLPAEAQEKPVSPGGLALGNGSQAASSGFANQNPVCFEVPSNYEITVAGRKLLGSAQARRKEGVLQHGSLPLYGDLGRIIRALSFSDAEQRMQAETRLHQRAANVQEILGERVEWQEAAMAFQAAFSAMLNLSWQINELTSQEQERARELLAEKHAAWEWISRC
jgi:lipoyl(octanoyl) transferase